MVMLSGPCKAKLLVPLPCMGLLPSVGAKVTSAYKAGEDGELYPVLKTLSKYAGWLFVVVLS